ncbi:septal ring lytic transglycosylase RlpA family lipoprotein [bacterium]|nr:septal ring lytic transglycosylase RlpA family lipoprotein [bacterium]
MQSVLSEPTDLTPSSYSQTTFVYARLIPYCPTYKVGIASYYHDKFEGRTTASGSVFSQSDLTVASLEFPLHTWLEICHENKCIIAEVTDRGPYVKGRVLDLSKRVKQELNCSDLCKVRYREVTTSLSEFLLDQR